MAESTQVSKFFFFFFLLTELLRDIQRTVRLVRAEFHQNRADQFGFVSASPESRSQHVQLPLKISMEPTSTEATANLQPPCAALLLCSRLSAHPSPPPFLSIPSLHPPRLAATDNDKDERTARVKGSSASSQSHQSQFHFVTCL